MKKIQHKNLIGLVCICLFIVSCVSVKNEIPQIENLDSSEKNNYGYVLIKSYVNGKNIGNNPNMEIRYAYKNTEKKFILNDTYHVFRIPRLETIEQSVPAVTPAKPALYKLKAGTYTFNQLKYKSIFLNKKFSYKLNAKDSLRYAILFEYAYPKTFVVKPNEITYIGDVLFEAGHSNLRSRVTDNFEEDLKAIYREYPDTRYLDANNLLENYKKDNTNFFQEEQEQEEQEEQEEVSDSEE